MPLHPTLATIKRNLPRVARELGFSARVTSGYRSTKKQAWLYDRYLRGLQEYPVAPPGTSDHERGLALDVVSTDPDKLVALLTEVGLTWAGPSDPVHFTMIGPQIASQSQFQIPTTLKRAAEISFIPAPLQIPVQIARFISDPLKAIEDNLGTALDIFSFL